MKIRSNLLLTIEAEFGRMRITAITTRDIAVFLQSYVQCGKHSMAVALRSLLMDVFREAVVEGIIDRNPVEPTRTPAPEVRRERLSLDQFLTIRQAAESMGGWLQNAMNIGLLAGQRR
ncbi:hypothetical protein NGC37_03730 [Pantoea anthophila]|uniref:phage integrase central domain-containing protein n=1 Tax=Pantoea anthophila TaxID=470931 RepID=UPI002DBBEDAE|nr:hypothetical protein [Pantoea anthophila]MEB7537419.1 hypothetical protein [Pantoea anthophila]